MFFTRCDVMSISFHCQQCGHPIEVDDRLGGKSGVCKHCGHHLVVPEHASAGSDSPLRLRPLDGDEPPGGSGHLLATPPPLKVRPATVEPAIKPAAISDPDELRPAHPRTAEDYPVLDPHRLTEHHSSAGPPPFLVLLPTMTARVVAGYFRNIRDWLYVISLAFLVAVLLGYLFSWRAVLHLGAAGVIATNIGMLCAGVAYLVTLPFKESLRHGLANVLVPGYAIYYWTTRWPRMKTPVLKTAGSFVPILLVGLAYFLYKEAPEIEREAVRIEQAIEGKVPTLEKKVDATLGPIERKVGVPESTSADTPPQ